MTGRLPRTLFKVGSLAVVVMLTQGRAQATGLNDTGIIKFGNATSNALTNEPADYPGQDASHGRDAAAGSGTLAKVGGGNAGFDFTKIDANGAPLSVDAPTWSCVRDNVTGLVWEVKTVDGVGLRDKGWTYTWYNSTGVNDGGSAGVAASTVPGAIVGGSCGGTLAAGCDTEKYVAAVNALVDAGGLPVGLCGATDWRLPSRKELLSLVDNGRSASPAIDTNYFPDTTGSWHYWTSSPNAENPDQAWYVLFQNGYVNDYDKGVGLRVRLVRGGM